MRTIRKAEKTTMFPRGCCQDFVGRRDRLVSSWLIGPPLGRCAKCWPDSGSAVCRRQRRVPAPRPSPRTEIREKRAARPLRHSAANLSIANIGHMRPDAKMKNIPRALWGADMPRMPLVAMVVSLRQGRFSHRLARTPGPLEPGSHVAEPRGLRGASVSPRDSGPSFQVPAPPECLLWTQVAQQPGHPRTLHAVYSSLHRRGCR